MSAELSVRVTESLCRYCGGIIYRVANEEWKHLLPQLILIHHNPAPKLTAVQWNAERDQAWGVGQ